MSKQSLKVRVVSIGETKTFGVNDFRKRQLVGSVNDGQYTNEFVFEFVNDKVDLLDGILPDTDVTVSFNIRCRKVEATDKKKDDMWFTSLNGWKIEV